MKTKVVLPNEAVFTKVDCDYTLVEIKGIKMHFKTTDIRLEEGRSVMEDCCAVYRLIVRYNAKERINLMDDVPLKTVDELCNFGIQIRHACVGTMSHKPD